MNEKQITTDMASSLGSARALSTVELLLQDVDRRSGAESSRTSETPGPVPIRYSRCYRMAERAFALSLLIMLLPVMVLLALVIKVHSPGPVFYRQVRVGRGETLFTIYKFRTMFLDAEKDGPFICTSYTDSRITTLGQVLRKTKLDELPQLLNIVLGQMAFVGPRPERPHFHEEFSQIPQWRERTRVFPGLTGLAQASRWISHDPKEKLVADLAYIEHRSFGLDIALVWFTLIPAFRPKSLHGIKFN